MGKPSEPRRDKGSRRSVGEREEEGVGEREGEREGERVGVGVGVGGREGERERAVLNRRLPF